MNCTEKLKVLVLRYFHSWQEPADYKEFRSCISDDLIFDSNLTKIKGGDVLTEFVRNNESPWEDAKLLGSLFLDSKAALFYEGTAKNNGIKTRVAEYIEISAGKIIKISAVISPLTN